MTIRPHTRSALLAGACCALALAATGCGSDEEGEGIPPEAARVLEGQLESIQGRVRNEACQDVTEGGDPNTQVVQNAINDLPSDVDPDVRDALEQSFQRLFQLVQEECRPTETTPTETTPTETIPPDTTPTETTPTETTPTETEEEPPPDEDGNQGRGRGRGRDGGGGGGQGNQGGGGGQRAPEGDD